MILSRLFSSDVFGSTRQNDVLVDTNEATTRAWLTFHALQTYCVALPTYKYFHLLSFGESLLCMNQDEKNRQERRRELHDERL